MSNSRIILAPARCFYLAPVAHSRELTAAAAGWFATECPLEAPSSRQQMLQKETINQGVCSCCGRHNCVPLSTCVGGLRQGKHGQGLRPSDIDAWVFRHRSKHMLRNHLLQDFFYSAVIFFGFLSFMHGLLLFKYRIGMILYRRSFLRSAQDAPILPYRLSNIQRDMYQLEEKITEEG